MIDMQADRLITTLKNHNISFFTGVPDSLLSAFSDCLSQEDVVTGNNHVIAHNEGGCIALASGYHLSTGSVACVYMQNSGLGNIVNPVSSLTHPNVYGIPMLLVIGWRGEPNVPDEPQHIFQGRTTLSLLDSLEIPYIVLDQNTTPQDIDDAMRRFSRLFDQGRSAAIVVRKGGLSSVPVCRNNNYTLNRENAIGQIVQAAQCDCIISTTGKISRELFEVRKKNMQSHMQDFLTVGSMGHCSMIALGIALQQPDRRIWCLDGDGAVLMHMGALTTIASCQPENFVHIVLNNESHESVGGAPTAMRVVNLSQLALSAGYRAAYSVETTQTLQNVLCEIAVKKGPIMLEIKVALGARSDLGRPSTSVTENKENFVNFLRGTQ